MELLTRNQREKIERFRAEAYENLFSMFSYNNHPLVENWVNPENQTSGEKIFQVKTPSFTYYFSRKDLWPYLLTDPELKAAFSHWKIKNNLTDTFDPEPLLIRTFLTFKSDLGINDSDQIMNIKKEFKGIFEDLKNNPFQYLYLIQIRVDFDTLGKTPINYPYFEYALKLLWMKIAETNNPLDIFTRSKELYENLFLVLIFRKAIMSSEDPNSYYLKYFSNRTDLDLSTKNKIEKLHNGFFKTSN